MQLALETNDPRDPAAREARLAAMREQYAEDEHAQDLRRKRHARARERHSDNHRRWYEEHRAERIEADRRWRAENPEKAAALARSQAIRRRAGRDDESAEWAAIVVADPCVYCGEPAHEVEHIVPLAGGGTNDWMNLTGACKSCNSSKSATPLLHFLLRRRPERR